MDRILSARVDETVVAAIGSLARRLHTSKKRIIEQAVETYVARVDKDQTLDVFAQTCGAWRRKESPDKIVNASRRAFRDSMERHQR